MKDLSGGGRAGFGIKTIWLGVLLALGLQGGAQMAWGQEPQWGDFRYVVNADPSNTVTITGYTGAGGDVVVPAEIEGLPVVAIGDNAFRWKWGLTGVVLPDSVERIGWGAFEWCDSLTNVSLGNGLVEIGDRAFYHCSSLSSISLPDSVERMGWRAFGWCSSLTNVSLGNGLLEIGDWAFFGCFELTAITIPGSVERIGG